MLVWNENDEMLEGSFHHHQREALNWDQTPGIGAFLGAKGQVSSSNRTDATTSVFGIGG